MNVANVFVLSVAVACSKSTSPVDSVFDSTAAPEFDSTAIQEFDSGYERPSVEAHWCLDHDSDGYGDPATMVVAGSMPEGYIMNCGDCDDENHSVNPDAVEIRSGFNTDGDGVDNDCDGLTDDEDPDACGDSYLWRDNDHDGWGGETIGLIRLCGRDLSIPFLREHSVTHVAFDCDDNNWRLQDQCLAH